MHIGAVVCRVVLSIGLARVRVAASTRLTELVGDELIGVVETTVCAERRGVV